MTIGLICATLAAILHILPVLPMLAIGCKYVEFTEYNVAVAFAITLCSCVALLQLHIWNLKPKSN